ncbi:AMP-binding protein [Alloalcanivorax gelatiniphagus]
MSSTSDAVQGAFDGASRTAEPVLKQSHWKPSPGRLFETSIGDALRETAAQIPDGIALVVAYDGRRLTWAELLDQAERGAWTLAARFPEGSHVAVWSSNRMEVELLQLAAAMAGVTVVMVNPALTRHEARFILEQSGSVAVFVDPTFDGGRLSRDSDVLRADIETLAEVFSLDDWLDLIATSAEHALPEMTPDAVAQIQYTSGTTGRPKGAMLTHRASLTNANATSERSGVVAGDVLLNPLPMFHIGSSTLCVFAAIVRHATHVLMSRFDAETVLDLVEAEGVNHLFVVPTMLHRLLDKADTGRDLSSLKSVYCGAANLPPSELESARRMFGCDLSNGYGMTEAHGAVTQTASSDGQLEQDETVGRPMPLTELRIVDPTTGAVVPVGVDGEIQIRGYQTTPGYFAAPEATAQAFAEDGWFRSGDIGTLDTGGYVRVKSRLKDVVIRGGENVYPAEVENVLTEFPGVVGVQVFGLPDPKFGEKVAAAVLLDPSSTVDLGAVVSWARERLAAYKVPDTWFEVGEFPMTSTNKVRKSDLRQTILDSGQAPSWHWATHDPAAARGGRS